MSSGQFSLSQVFVFSLDSDTDHSGEMSMDKIMRALGMKLRYLDQIDIPSAVWTSAGLISVVVSFGSKMTSEATSGNVLQNIFWGSLSLHPLAYPYMMSHVQYAQV